MSEWQRATAALRRGARRSDGGPHRREFGPRVDARPHRRSAVSHPPSVASPPTRGAWARMTGPAPTARSAVHIQYARMLTRVLVLAVSWPSSQVQRQHASSPSSSSPRMLPAAAPAPPPTGIPPVPGAPRPRASLVRNSRSASRVPLPPTPPRCARTAFPCRGQSGGATPIAATCTTLCRMNGPTQGAACRCARAGRARPSDGGPQRR